MLLFIWSLCLDPCGSCWRPMPKLKRGTPSYSRYENGKHQKPETVARQSSTLVLRLDWAALTSCAPMVAVGTTGEAWEKRWGSWRMNHHVFKRSQPRPGCNKPPKVSKWSQTIKIGYAERWILSILRAPPCRKFDADGKGVGCMIDCMTISEGAPI